MRTLSDIKMSVEEAKIAILKATSSGPINLESIIYTNRGIHTDSIRYAAWALIESGEIRLTQEWKLERA